MTLRDNNSHLCPHCNKDIYGEEDWLVRYYDHEGRHGDGLDYDSLEEAIVAFDEGVDRQPKLEWTLYHYYDYKPDGDGGWHEPTEKLLRHWVGHVLEHDEIGPDTVKYNAERKAGDSVN